MGEGRGIQIGCTPMRTGKATMQEPKSEPIPEEPTEPSEGTQRQRARDNLIDLLREAPSKRKQNGNQRKKSKLSRKEKSKRRRQRKRA
jgi:hypothetical protein